MEDKTFETAWYRLLQDDIKWHKRHTSIAQATDTGILEALYKTEEYLLKDILNLHK